VTIAPADWYPDPTDPERVRYWDGSSWTEHFAPRLPAVSVGLGPTTPDGEPLAGWWLRGAARLIDGLVIGAINFIVTLPIQAQALREQFQQIDELERQLEQNPEAMPKFGDYFGTMFGADRPIWSFLAWLLVVVIYVGGMWRWRGATLGKLALGLRVRLRDSQGQLPWRAIGLRLIAFDVAVGTLDLLGRLIGPWQLIALVSVAGSIYLLVDVLWAAFDDKRQAIHDKLAGTNVVRVRWVRPAASSGVTGN
jgi:uncharacterized RDD family membrane protein YckC